MNVKKSISDFVLLALEKSVDGYVIFEDFAYNPMLVGRDIKKAAFSQALKRLREGGLIELVSDEKLAFRLTDTGREKAVLANLKFDERDWDGRWRLVIFDIPEKRRQARDLLRSKLKQWEFVHFQQSVWGTKKNCTKVLRDFIKSVGIDDWVMIVESGDIGRSQ